jgi:hypothetical protein
MTTSTRTRTSRSDLFEDVEDVLTDVVGDFVQKHGPSLQSMVKTAVRDAVKGALIGAFQGLLDAVVDLLRTGGTAVYDFLVGILERLKRLLLLALETTRRLLHRLSGRLGSTRASEHSDEGENPDDMDEIPDDEGEIPDDMEPARAQRTGGA